MLNITEFIKPNADQIKAVAKQSADRAQSFKEVRSVLAAKFEGNKRVGLDTLLSFMDERVAEYTAASDPAYWDKANG